MRHDLAAVALCLLSVPAVAQTYSRLTAATGGAVSVGNTFQQVLPQNNGRYGCLIQNTSAAVELLSPGAAPTAATSISLAAGALFDCAHGQIIISDRLSITSATAASTFVVWAQ